MAGCSTTNHAPLASMVYHDITGHYNAYFNTKQKLLGVYATMDKTHKDNYKDVLSLNTYSNPKEAAAVTADLEDIEKRETVSVQIHKVSNWTDDQFLQMGKANYIKGNYDRAASFFKYTTTEYKNGVDYVKEMKKMGKIAKPTLKKKKAVKKPKFEEKLDEKGNLVLNKIDQRPSYTWLIHEPARAEALVWLAKTYSAQKKYAEASAVIQFMRSDDKFYTNLDKDVELVDAENYLNQKDYHDAIKPLEKFITMTRKKSERVRPIFILAQIYEKNGDYAKASEYYKEVLNNRPSYEMEFYAKIKRAKLGKKSNNSDDIKKLLLAMSHDGKYHDYLDQIYYELGMIVLGENNRAEARKDFHKSVANSTKNPDQKALSYLELAKMDYDEEYYVSSKFLYDTALLSLSKTDSSYEGVQARDKTLGKLVTQLTIITTEDSLQRIANMSEADRSRFLTQLIANKQKEADAKAAEKDRGRQTINPDFLKGATPGANSSVSPEESSFYFYNVSSRSNGYSEFIKKWGNRKLEENWRRKDKTATLAENTDETDSAKAKANAKDSTVVLGSEEQKLMAGLPMTPELMEKSNVKLVEAYYALGTVYKDDLQSYFKAMAAFEELNKRFPKNKLELESFYQLYLLEQRTKNNTKADFYKDQILAKYPNSNIARYLKDPNYLAQITKALNSLSDYYSEAYNDYSSGMYASAEKKVHEVDAQFKENKMRAKFDILNAMILSKENRLGDYVESLNKIIAKYPGTPEKDQAQIWLTQLNHSKLPQIDISKLPKDSLGNTEGAATAVTSIPHTDTTGRAAFLAQLEADNKKAKAKQDAKNQELDALAAAKATADSLKAHPKDTSAVAVAAAAKAAKPYKPLSRTERLDSLMNAERNGHNATTASIIKSTPKTAPDTASKPAPATAKKDTAAAPPALSAKDKLNAAIKTAAVRDSLTKTAAAARTASKDSLAKATAAKTAMKDSLAKVTAAKTAATKDSLSKVAAAKAAATKDSLAKKAAATKPATAAKPAAKDTVATKPAPKPAPAPIAAAPKPAEPDTAQIFGKSDNAPHYVMVYLLDPAAFNNAAVAKIEQFNDTTYAAQRLNARAVILDKDNKLIVMKPFKDKDAAMAYITALSAKLDVIMPGIKPNQYFIGAITSLNYTTLIQKQKINNYIHFYSLNYK